MDPGITILTPATLRELIGKGDELLVEFSDPRCTPCVALSAVLEEVQRERSTMHIAQLNVSDYPAVAQQFKVKTVPTMILFKHGAHVRTVIGARNKRQILRELDRVASDG